jgi:hypothetical protein
LRRVEHFVEFVQVERFPMHDHRNRVFDHANDHFFQMVRADLEEEFEYSMGP